MERMDAQFVEGFPFISPRGGGGVRLRLDGDLAAELGEFYERFLMEDLDSFSISPQRAAGLHAFLDLAPALAASSPLAVKGQITGCLSLGLAVKTEDGVPLADFPHLMEASIWGLRMRVRWQIRALRALGPRVMVLIDEPSFALAHDRIGVTPESLVHYLLPLVEEIQGEGALAGVHCCGPTDWNLVLGSGVDVASVEAHAFPEAVEAAAEGLADLMRRGGVVAWGMVPTGAEAETVTAEALAGSLERLWARVARHGVDLAHIQRQSLITPVCGLGDLSPERARRVLELTRDLSRLVGPRARVAAGE